MRDTICHFRHRRTLTGKIQLEMAPEDAHMIRFNLGLLLLKLDDPTVDGLFKLFGAILEDDDDV